MSRLEKKTSFQPILPFFFGTPSTQWWLREATETLLKNGKKVGEDGAKEFTQNKIP